MSCQRCQKCEYLYIPVTLALLTAADLGNLNRGHDNFLFCEWEEDEVEVNESAEEKEDYQRRIRRYRRGVRSVVCKLEQRRHGPVHGAVSLVRVQPRDRTNGHPF